jgi:O-antigen/teichoic acid export membrane protein
LLGKYSDFVSVGLFERSSSLAQMFQRVIMQSVWSVAMPAFAKLSRDGVSLAEPYGRAVGMVCALGAMFFTWMLIYADSIVHVMLGDTWMVAVVVVRLIVVGSFFGLPNALSGSLLVATGQIKTQTVVTMVLRGASIAAVAIGVSYGAVGVASCLIVSSCIANGWLLYFLRRSCNVRLVLREAAKAYALCLAPALMALVSGLSQGPA